MLFKIKIFLSLTLICLKSLVFSQVSIKGKVTDSETGEPVPGATIRLEGSFRNLQTREDGSFMIKKLARGIYNIRVDFTGKESFYDTLSVFSDTTISVSLKDQMILMDEVVVKSTRVNELSGMAYGNLDKKEISEQNLGQDLPYLLNQQPSVVTTSDAGAGVGYSGIRIRGVDATRINVTINGIPVNDAESQGTYWVDLPDISSSIDNIQVQRGAGTSTNGAGAFGASLNIQTIKLTPKPYGEYNTSYGSFNTWKNTVNAGTGLLNDKFAIDARLSKLVSDGFIDRASSDLKSYYLSGAYYGKKSIIKFITFSGMEETYQAWNGIPESRLRNDKAEMEAFIARNYLDQEDADNLLNSGSRTYNSYLYNNQVDHYKQDYYQLHFAREINKNLTANIALHYTKGKGYYEEYKKDQSFSSYGLNDVYTNSDTITSTDLVRRRWLDNDFYGTTFSIQYNTLKNFSAIAGGAWNQYTGLHYGEIKWAEFSSNSQPGDTYYKDTATKTDLNFFIKANYLLVKKLNIFADIQYRKVDYTFLGFDNSLRNISQSASLNFFNPKAGLNFAFSEKSSLYASWSVAHKEPSRDDYTQSTPTSRPQAETLNDIELGFRHRSDRAEWELNIFDMIYKDQLVLTGEVNDVGAYNRTNVERSYRKGIEAEFAFKIMRVLTWEGNLTLSENKVVNFKEYIDNYDSTSQRLIIHKNTDLAFSPAVIAGSSLSFEPFKNFKISFISKYVGKQYLDNTSNETNNPNNLNIIYLHFGKDVNQRSLDPFFVNDVRVNYTFKTKFIHEIGITLAIYNIFNETYESNGYTYGYIYGGERITENFYYPQAGTNFMAGLSFKF